MSNFEDIIKQKVAQFEPKFNEAHWNEMDQKLNTIKKTKIIKNSIYGFATLALVLLGVYFASNPSVSTRNKLTKYFNKKHVSTQQNIQGPALNIDEKLSIKDAEKLIQQPAQTIADEQIETQQSKTIQKNNTIDQFVKPSETQKNTVLTADNLTADFMVYNNQICLGEEVSFDAEEKKDLIAFAWDFGDGTTSNKQNPKHQYKSAGNFSVTLAVTNKRTNQEIKSTQRNVVSINSLPIADFTYTEQSSQYDDNKLKYPSTIFSCKADTKDVCEWNFGNGITSKVTNPAILFEKKGDYVVTLKSKNEFGCANSISKTIQINTSFELFAPNAFTPNFDGNNDVFMPEALQTWDIKFELVIKNKSGNVIYNTKDKNEGWNGSLNNQGSVLDADLYFWQVVTYDIEGNPHQHVGKINLIK